jgi:glyoxylase-like metal-dependent hydrolase (beta-lactamase superfamily II)
VADPAVQLAPGVWRIPTAPFDLVNSFAFVDDDEQVTLVDCGVRRAPRRIVDGLAAIGKRPADVTRILLTHAHPDHAGGAAEMVSRTGAGVAVHSDDAPFLANGQSPPPDRSTRLGRLMARRSAGFSPVRNGTDLRDGQVLDVGGGLRVVHTPGHSPGHVSLLHERTGVLITGDALFNVLGFRGVTWSFRALCTDFRLSQQTAHVLGELDYRVAAFTHGAEIRDGAREAIRTFLARNA